MTIIFENDFEDNFNSWTRTFNTVGNTIAVASDQKYSGIYSAKAVTVAAAGFAFVSKTYGVGYNTIFCQLYGFLSDPVEYGTNYFAQLRDSNDVYIARFGIYREAGIYYLRIRDEQKAINHDVAIVWSPNAWHCYEIKVLRDTNGEFRAWYDNVETVTVTTDLTVGTTTMGTIQVGSIDSDQPVTNYIEKVVVSDAHIGTGVVPPTEKTLSYTSSPLSVPLSVLFLTGPSTSGIDLSSGQVGQIPLGINAISLSVPVTYTGDPVSPIQPTGDIIVQAIYREVAIIRILTINTSTGGTTSITSGSYSYNDGDTAQIIAIPSAGYQFDHWIVDGVQSGTTTILNLLMNTNHTVAPIFALMQQTLTILSSIGGTTNPATGAHNYATGSQAQVTATANTGYVFDHWLFDGITSGTQNPITVTMDINHTLQAIFTALQTLTILSGTGGLTNPTTGTYSYVQGLQVQVGATANTGYAFDHWIVDGTSAGSTNPLSITMSANHNIQPVFVSTTITLIAVAGTNGSVSPAGTYQLTIGSAYQFIATPNSGYNFDHWTLSGLNYSATNPLIILVTTGMNNQTLSAVFTVATVTITATGINCTTNPIGSQILIIGNSYTFLALPNSGYTFSNWVLGTANVGSTNPLNLTATLDMNGKTLTATSTLTPPVQIQLNVATDPMTGTVNPSSGNFNVGSTVQFTAIPNSGYIFKQWNLGIATYTVNPLNISITNDMNGQTLTAIFTKTQVTLTSTAGANGSVAPVGSWILNIGQTYQFTAIPSNGYTFDHWDIGGQNKGSTNPISITATVEMDGATLTAIFTVIPPQQIIVTVAVQGNGTTDLAPGTHEFHAGDTITIAAIPSAGNAFKQWQLDGMTYKDNPLSLPVTTDLNGKTLTAEFVSFVPTQAGFPIWSIPASIVILIGGYVLSRKGEKTGKNRKG